MSGEDEGRGGSGGNTMRLVKWLVIIGIGIPVLVEVLTLFNLVQVRLFEEEEQVSEVFRQGEGVEPDGVPILGEGDLLTPEDEVPVLRLREKMILVAPEEWQFLMSVETGSLSAMGEGMRFRFWVDSLRLRSGEVLEEKGPFRWEPAGMGEEGDVPEIEQFRWRWTFPAGDLPQRLFVRFEWEGGVVAGGGETGAAAEEDKSAGDSLRVVRREFSLGNIPTRYQDGEEN